MIVPFKTEKAEGLFVKVPISTTGFYRLDRKGGYVAGGAWRKYIPKGDYTNHKILGITKDLTDKQISEILHFKPIVEKEGDLTLTVWTTPELEDLQKHWRNFMKGVNVYEKNPMGENEPVSNKKCGGITDSCGYDGKYCDCEKLVAWKYYQARTGNWLVLIKSPTNKADL